MSRRLLVGLLLWYFALSTAHGWASVSRVEILVQLTEPAAPALQMEYTLREVQAPTLTLAIPTWTPGWYQTMPYAQGIRDLQAWDERGNALEVKSVDASSWQVETGGARTVYLRYRVLAREEGMGFFGVATGERHAFVNGAAAFLYEMRSKGVPHVVRFRLPPGWQVATAMEFVGQSEQRAFGDVRDTFLAPNYDELIDNPIQMGLFVVHDFQVRGVSMRAVFAPENLPIQCPTMRIVERLRRIAETTIDLFGSAPFRRYLFIIHLSSKGFAGGLEHLYSTVLNVPDSPALNIDALAAHEFFHAWNVKRIRPKVLGPFDYTQPVRTRALWWCEGVTDYYTTLILLRAGLIGEREFWSDLEREIWVLENNPARTQVSLEEASWRVWEGNGMGYGGLSYYNKGKVVGFLWDVYIRGVTGNRRSLDDVMRLMMDRYAYPKPGFEEEGILESINRIVGADCSPLYRQMVASPEPLPYEQLLRYIGMRLEHQVESITYFGATTRVDSVGRVLVQAVESQSPAFQMGLRAGDMIMYVDDQPASGRLEEVISRKGVDEPIRISVWRSGRLQVLEGRVGGERRTRVRLITDPNASETALRIREGLLRGTTVRAR